MLCAWSQICDNLECVEGAAEHTIATACQLGAAVINFGMQHLKGSNHQSAAPAFKSHERMVP